MSRGFTLVETILSLVLGALIFFYAYSSINSTKKNHETYVKQQELLSQEQRIFLILYEDIFNALGSISSVEDDGFDALYLRSRQSLHGFSQPYIYYFVSSKENALVRIESREATNLSSLGGSRSQTFPYMYGEILGKDTSSIRVNVQDEWVDVMIHLTNQENPMVFRVSREQ